MRKLKLEKITGVVALAYLVLIPAGAVYVWRKMEAMDEDITTMWDKLELPATDAKPIIDLRAAMEGVRRSLAAR